MKRKYKHRKGRNRHHLFRAKCKHGSSEPYNMLLIDIERHEYFHKIFGLKSLDEVIALLQRIKRAKIAQKGNTDDYSSSSTVIPQGATVERPRVHETNGGCQQPNDNPPSRYGRPLSFTR